VLPRQHRLNKSAELRQVLRRGRRFAIPEAVVSVTLTSQTQFTRLGLVTPKVVGNSVVRHRVARAIRHAGADLIKTHPSGFDVAVRALAGSSQLSVDQWRVLLEKALTKAQSKTVDNAQSSS
jgi:ribonuclease P protein component